jgi:DNA-binding transcriptional regulator YhcF (GntR family)
VILQVEPDSPVPPYEQIRQQMSAMVATGVLPDGARLPTIRQLATDLGLAGGTVARAYRELESEGAIVTRGRHGTFVSGAPAPSNGDADLEQAARSFAVRAKQLGADPDRAIVAVRSALESF